MVHDDDAALAGNEAVTRYDHLHPENQLQQRLRRQTHTAVDYIISEINNQPQDRLRKVQKDSADKKKV